MRHSEFLWIAGIECSFIPHLGIDQYRWTQHDRFWREDFARAADDLGCRWLRYAVPWHQIEARPGVFDWTWFDERLAHADSLGLKFLLDLVHFGTPAWLPDSFADADFLGALERFARAFGERYAGRVPFVCPVNEPLITALFCGDIGLWPPYGRGLRSYMTVLSRVAQAICRSIRALRETMPGVQILLSDALEVAVTQEDSDETTSPFLRESLRADVARRMQRRHLVTDLIMGRVDARHPLAGWLEQHGFPEWDLRWLRRNAQTLDILGLDYYGHTEVELYTTPEGYYRQRCLEPPIGLYRAAQDYWNRYHIPLMVTETSASGADADKLAWLERSVNDVRRLRAEGFPVIGYTWWPLIDHLDWDGALLHQTGHIHPVGIYRLTRGEDGRLDREPTALREAYQELIAHGDSAAGPWIETEEQREPPALPQSAALLRPIIAHGDFPWNDFPRRTHHLIGILSRKRRILYVEPPEWTDEPAPRTGLGFHPVLPNLISISMRIPAQLRDDSDAICRRLLAEALAQAPLAGHFERPIQWIADHSAAANGVDLRHFARARRGRRAAVPNDLQFVPKPVLGYRGMINQKLDLALVAALADADPNWSIVMIGPVRVDPNSLVRRPNIFWLGPRPYGEMPDYAFGIDVGIAPLLPGTKQPAMIAECQVIGRPVVCTPATHAEFIERCRAAIAHPDHAALDRAARCAAKRSWRKIASEMERLFPIV